MKTIAFVSAAALIALGTPAQAQILGGGLGGVIGGGGQGSIGSTLDTSIRSLPRVDSSTIGATSGSGEARASKKVDRRSGKVDASGSAQGQGGGSLDQTLAGPLGSTTGRGSASGSAAGSGNASAQLIGTDAVRSTAGAARSRASGAVQAVHGAAGSALAGSGSATGGANGSAAGGMNPFALTGSAAGSGAGAIELEKGTSLFDLSGEKIGKVRQVVTDARGNLRALVVKVDGETATLPASAFSTNGSLLLTAMSEGQIKTIAKQQEQQEKSGNGNAGH